MERDLATAPLRLLHVMLKGVHTIALAMAGCLAMQAPAVAQVADQSKSEVAPPGLGLSRWINPATAPFIPVPVVGTDPNSGTTLGILPTWVHTNDQDEISRIVAPDFIHNPNFGYGADGRIFSYPSDNEQWSLVAGLDQRVQRTVDFEYQTELSRKRRWSINYSVIYNRDGSPRFYGLGNRAAKSEQTGYTKVTQLAQVQVGLNLNHIWQIQYTFRPQRVDIRPSSLKSMVSIETRFADVDGLGSNNVILNRLALIFDTRDDFVVPRTGMQWAAYGGLASRSGIGDSLYREAGIDGRMFAPVSSSAVLAVHCSLRYLLHANRVPFWALPNIGGDRDEMGGPQELRGFGAGRYYDTDSASATVELRQKAFSFDAGGSHIDIEATPFVDVASVFGTSQSTPWNHVHTVAGLGFRGVARPFVVGYVDIGYGSDGVATFTGINYPF